MFNKLIAFYGIAHSFVFFYAYSLWKYFYLLFTMIGFMAYQLLWVI